LNQLNISLQIFSYRAGGGGGAGVPKKRGGRARRFRVGRAFVQDRCQEAKNFFQQKKLLEEKSYDAFKLMSEC
jgi:hypothetical protein